MIFHNQLRQLNYANTGEALKHMSNHIRYIQERLEYTLMNLDSSNITEIDTSQTNISASGDGVDLTGNRISLSGKNGESFTVGMEADCFVFTVNGKGGTQSMYMTSDGELVITKHTKLSIDCGEW